MGLKLLKSRSTQSTNNHGKKTKKKNKTELETSRSTTESVDSINPPSFDHVPYDLNLSRDDDVSSIHFGESVSSPDFVFTAPPASSSRNNKNNSSMPAPPPLKFVRSDSQVKQRQRYRRPQSPSLSPSQLSRESATPPIDNTTHHPLPPLTSDLFLSFVVSSQEEDVNGKNIVHETLQRHVKKTVENQRLHNDSLSRTLSLRRRRTSVPVNVDDVSFAEQQDASTINDLVGTHLQRGNVTGAIEVYQVVLSSRQTQQQSQLYSQLSLLYILDGNSKRAIWSSERALQLQLEQQGQESQEFVAALVNLGMVLLHCKLAKKALSEFRQALQLECQLVGYHHKSIPLLLNNMAIIHAVLGDADAAMVLLQESLQLQRDAHYQADLNSLQNMATTLLNVGIVASKRNDYDSATCLFEEGLLVMESILGVDDDYVQVCAARMQDLLQQQYTNTTVPLPKPIKMPVFGHFDGIPMRQGSHPVDVVIMGSLKHELTLQARVHNAVTTTFRSGMIGIPMRKASFPIDVDADEVLDAELHLEAIHAQVLKHVQHGEIDEGLDLLRSTLRNHRKKYGAIHHLVGTGLHNIALVNLYTGRYKDAEWYFQEAISVRVAALGTNHVDGSTSMLKLGMIQMANGNLDMAYVTLTQVLHARRKELGHHQPEVSLLRIVRWPMHAGHILMS